MSLIEAKKSNFKKSIIVLIVITCLLAIPMVSLATGKDRSRDSERSKIAKELEEYSGVFSTAVTVSINPPATLAVLAIFGTIENMAAESDVAFLNDFADFLDGIPVVREMRYTPVSNAYAAAMLTLMGIAWVVLNSTKVTAAIAKHVKWLPIEKINRVASNICYVGLSFMPLLTNDAVAATNRGTKSSFLLVKAIGLLGKNAQGADNSPLAYFLAVVTSVAAVFCGNIVYSCVVDWETIVTAVPMKGSNVIWQIVKIVIHSLMLVLQIFAPIINVIIAIHLVIASFFIIRYLRRVARYYTDIYIFTILQRIFKRNKPIPRIERRVPRRLKKLYPNMEIAMSVYTFHGYARLAKRSRVWLIKDGDKIDLVYKRLIRKPYVITWANLHEDKTIYLERCLRFLRIRTEDKKIEFVMSNRYKPEAEMLSELLDLKDFVIVKEERKETRKLNRKLRRERWKNKFKRKKAEADVTI